MDIFACLLGQAAEEGSGKQGGLRVDIPKGVFVFEDAYKVDSVVPSDKQSAGDDGDPAMEGECLSEHMRFLWWQADAWAETTLDAPTFILTVLYETLPIGVAGLTCWLIEGKASAQNRNLVLIPALGKEQGGGVVFQGLFTTLPWVILVLWLVWRPEEVPTIDALFPIMLMVWRAACISMKYGYFAPSDLERVRTSVHFTKTMHAARLLGFHKFFNMAGTLIYDHMEDLFKSAVRVNLLQEARTGFLTVCPNVAKQVWDRLREHLQPETVTRTLSKKVPRAGSWQSKYGDVQEMLGLASVEDIDAQVSQGKLPLAVAAYYFIHNSWGGGNMKRMGMLMMLGGAMGFLHPLVSHFSGKAAFGTSPVAHAIYGLRVMSVALFLMPIFLYLLFPLKDGSARWKMSWSLISSFGRGEARARRLCRGFRDPEFNIQTMSDLKAFWTLSRLLGPAYESGQLTRYSSAFVAVHVFFLAVATGSLLLASRHGETSWGVSAELTFLFILGSLAVVSASLFCVNLNWQVPMYVGIAREAALRYPELGGVAKDVCADLQNEHIVVNPVQIMYIAATPALLSLLWSGMVLLAGVFFASLPSVCLPLFLSWGCS